MREGHEVGNTDAGVSVGPGKGPQEVSSLPQQQKQSSREEGGRCRWVTKEYYASDIPSLFQEKAGQ